MPHDRVPRDSFHFARVLEEEPALFRVAAGLVTYQALLHADLRPHLVREVIVHGPRAHSHSASRLLIAPEGDAKDDPCDSRNHDEQARFEGHSGYGIRTGGRPGTGEG